MRRPHEPVDETVAQDQSRTAHITGAGIAARWMAGGSVSRCRRAGGTGGRQHVDVALKRISHGEPAKCASKTRREPRSRRLTTLIFATVLAVVKSWGRIRGGRTPGA
jgi:hypothetical protein